ncbi:MAG TPA: hypothetical protein VFW48_05145 [Solirubrobacterales bacterium]|nr:hypothetical protein [Solirubrobacterales bacterium]
MAAPAKRMRLAAARQREEVLKNEDRSLERSLSTLLESIDMVWTGIADEDRESREEEADAFESALLDVGVHPVPEIRKTLKQALDRGLNQRLTLKLDDGQFDAVREDLRETVLALTAWSPGAKPSKVFAGQGGQRQASVAEAAKRLCLICVPREKLSESQRSRTFEAVRLLAPQLSPERLDALERCLQRVELGQNSDEALRPGLTGRERIGVVPLWPDPERHRQRWAVAADSSWVFASPVDGATRDDADRVVQRMEPRWERLSLPDHGAALGSVLVEVAIQSAARRAQVLGRAAEDTFPLEDEGEIHVALDRLAFDLAELNTGVDELELAAADVRADLERTLDSLPDGGHDEELYRSLRDSLDEALDKLDRQQQRLQGSFFAAREHAASHHVAGTVVALRQNQEAIAEAQQATDALNAAVSRLTIMLLGPTIVFGALGVTDYWFPHGDYMVSLAVLFAFVLAGFAVSRLICRHSRFFTRFFTPDLKRD